ncbi:hypothetical protein FHP29_08630 [Nocardioides albidus]|uniref:Uncharacterized protein n=1 Tax=Nocardioides albidus TaxID=1517589 RepID=A0A5C4W1G4_9ACTN|nr:hypothetical protein [Nocardioides albidus]TNM42018.1 hypothetical protein FHP29_08630 [Nocardioides albidus]
MLDRHLTLGSLALVAVLGAGSGLLPPAAATPGTPLDAGGAGGAGGANGCGQPEVPAQWGTIVHPAVTRTVEATTRTEWLWQRATATLEREYARESVAAVVLVHWSRTVEVTEREYARTVVDTPARPASPEEGHTETRVVTPAVTVVEVEYAQQHNGNTRWERAGWNGADNGNGWTATGRTRVSEVTPAETEEVWVVDRAAVPAQPEQSHVETAWVVDGTTPPAGSAPTGRTRVASSATEEQDLPAGESPAGSGWVESATSEISAAEYELAWLADGTTPGAGFVATGRTRAGSPGLETSGATSSLPPAGDGWTQVPGSSVEVLVEVAHEVVETPAWVEDYIVVPGRPATPACVLPIDEGVDPPTVVPPPGSPAPVPFVPAVLGVGEVQPVIDAVVVPDGQVAPATATPATATPASGALPATGA